MCREQIPQRSLGKLETNSWLFSYHSKLFFPYMLTLFNKIYNFQSFVELLLGLRIAHFKNHKYHIAHVLRINIQQDQNSRKNKSFSLNACLMPIFRYMITLLRRRQVSGELLPSLQILYKLKIFYKKLNNNSCFYLS